MTLDYDSWFEGYDGPIVSPFDPRLRRVPLLTEEFIREFSAMFAPDNPIHQCLSLVREQEHVYIRSDDVNIEVKGEVATFSWADTGKEIMRMSANLRVEDFDAIFAAMNQAFRDGVDVGKDDARACVMSALGL